jgi:outer membrane receptor protein involved in Fe transport
MGLLMALTASLEPPAAANARSRCGAARAAGWLAFSSMTALASGAWAAGGPGPSTGAVTAAAVSTSATTPVALEEVIVTARKRAEDIKSIPLSVSALGADALRERRITDFEDLSRALPNVAFNSGAMEGVTNISIRGVSSTAGTATVGTYIDDVSITVPNLFYEGNIEPRLPDLDRLEVLRGPQGTLYGDSSEGGTIRFITRAPNLETYSADLIGDVSGTERGGVNYSGTGTISVPVVQDKFALRISGSHTYDSGWIDHFAQQLVDFAPVGAGARLAKGVNWDRLDTAHVVAELAPTSDLTITPAFFFQKYHANDSSAFYIDTPGLGIYDQDKQVKEFNNDELKLASLTIHDSLGFADLTSVTGYFVRDHDRQEDGTFFNSTVFADFFLAALPGICPVACPPLPNPVDPAISPQDAINIMSNLPSTVELQTHTRQITQELRLSSPETGPGQRFKWVAGLYFADQKVHNRDFQQIHPINAEFLSLYGVTLEQSSAEVAFNGGVPNTVLFPNDVDEFDDRTYHSTQYAAFGQIDYDPVPSWHLGVGGRYEYSKEDFNSVEAGFYQIGNISPYHQQADASSFTPKFTVSHDFSPAQSLYASASKGFRLGGPTGPIVFGPGTVCALDFAAINQTTQPTQFASDSLWTYEVGSKGAYLGNRLSVNAAGFYTDWHNIQQQIYLPICGYYFTENAGDARIYGGEIEAAFRVTSDLSLNVTGTANSAKITKSINPVDIPVGAHLIDVPVGAFTVGAVYDHPLQDGFDLSARIDYAYTGYSYGSYQKINPVGQANLNYNNPSYGVLNASVSLTKGKYILSLYAKNLLNDQTLIQTPEINTVYQGYTVHPRVIGLTFVAHL